MRDDELIQWLFANSAPILRYRVAVELLPASVSVDRAQLLRDALATPEMQRWLNILGHNRGIHGSQDEAAENALAKLLDYGLTRHVPELDERVQPLLKRQYEPSSYDPLILYPFLLCAGYADHPLVAQKLAERIELLYRTAQRGDYDFYISAAEAAGVPKAWQGKPIYKDAFGSAADYALPTCYDFYAMAYCPPVAGIKNLKTKLEAIAGFLSDPRFQSTVGGYGWDRKLKRCYAAGRVFLACAEPARLVLFMELGARFAAVRQSEWFQQGMATLRGYHTAQGTYRFPPKMLAEKTGYYIYSGSHMGMGESRRSAQALELESTFRMLLIEKRMRMK